MAYPALKAGIPRSSDTIGHLFKVWFIGEHIKEFRDIPAWTTFWYMGTNVLKYYPPLYYFLIMPWYLILKDPFAAHKVFTVIWIISLGASVYYVAYKRYGEIAAVVVAILVTLAPAVLRTYFYDGGVAQALAFVSLPWAYHFTLNIAAKDKPLRDVVGLGVVFTVLTLSHAMMSAYMAIVLFLVVFIYEMTAKDKRPMAIFRYTGGVLLGMGLAAAWLIPATAGSVGSAASPDSIKLMSAPLMEMLGRGFRTALPNARYLSVALITIALLGLLRRRGPEQWGLALMALFSVIFVLGYRTPLFNLVPLSNQIMPERSLFVAVFALAMLAGRLLETSVEFNPKNIVKLATAALILGVYLFDISPAFALVANKPEPEDIIHTMEAVKTSGSSGRVATLGTWAPEFSFYVPVVSGRDYTEGYFFQGTEHAAELASTNIALKTKASSNYIHRKLFQWNTRYIVAPAGFKDGNRGVIPEQFKKKEALGGWETYGYAAGATPVQRLTRNVLTVGKNAHNISIIFPWVAEGSLYIDDYEWPYLSRFDELILSGFNFRDRKKTIELLTKYVNAGKLLIIDLQGMEGEFGIESASFLDVMPAPITVKGEVDLVIKDKGSLLAKMPNDLKPFNYEGEDWRTVGYTGLDESLVDVGVDGKKYGVIGYKRLGTGRVWFVGLNLYYHTLLHKDKNAERLLDKVMEQGKPNKNMLMPGFPLLSFKDSSDECRFVYSAKETETVIVSRTWTANWRATIDGKPVAVYDYENLPALILPAGRHTVDFIYGLTPLEYVGRLLTILAFTALCLMVKKLTDVKKTSGDKKTKATRKKSPAKPQRESK